jgi:hypothetical protein
LPEPSFLREHSCSYEYEEKETVSEFYFLFHFYTPIKIITDIKKTIFGNMSSGNLKRLIIWAESHFKFNNEIALIPLLLERDLLSTKPRIFTLVRMIVKGR